MCLSYGWSVEYILEMPAKRFFSLRRSLFEIEKEKKYTFLSELCDISAISLANADYYKQLKDMFRSIVSPKLVEGRSRTFDPTKKEDSDIINSVLSGAIAQAKRLRGLV